MTNDEDKSMVAYGKILAMFRNDKVSAMDGFIASAIVMEDAIEELGMNDAIEELGIQLEIALRGILVSKRASERAAALALLPSVKRARKTCKVKQKELLG